MLKTIIGGAGSAPQTRPTYVITWLVALMFATAHDAIAAERTQPQRPEEVCAHPRADEPTTAPMLAVYEVRATDRLEQDLLKVDGINLGRDVVVIVCSDVVKARFHSDVANGHAVTVEVRSWQKPRDGGWQEIRINEPSAEQVDALQQSGATERNWRIEERVVRVTKNTVVDPLITVPLRRDNVKEDDLVRLRVRISPEQPAPTEQNALPPPPENEQVLDATFKVGRFGLHVSVADLVVFVQRMGEDRANSSGTNPVIFDQVNFRPAPGVSYGFNYYHRRHALFRFLEPGFGVHLAFLNWNERVRNAATSDSETTQATNLQVGIGGMASMFDGTVVVVSGWNLQVKDQRPYFGVGFSITGLARKFSQGLR